MNEQRELDSDWPMFVPEVQKPVVEAKRDDFGHRRLVQQALEEGPPEWMQPDRPRLRWEVQCFNGNGKPISSAVYVIAADQERAVKAGKYWMRVVGIKRRGDVKAKRYYPERDPAFQYGDWRIVPTPSMNSSMPLGGWDDAAALDEERRKPHRVDRPHVQPVDRLHEGVAWLRPLLRRAPRGSAAASRAVGARPAAAPHEDMGRPGALEQAARGVLRRARPPAARLLRLAGRRVRQRGRSGMARGPVRADRRDAEPRLAAADEADRQRGANDARGAGSPLARPAARAGRCRTSGSAPRSSTRRRPTATSRSCWRRRRACASCRSSRCSGRSIAWDSRSTHGCSTESIG
jgi:hypothetical protein